MTLRQITTSIPYMNGTLHTGHALEFFLTDSLARYYRYRGNDTFFLTGSDEHGVKNYMTAKKLGKTTIEMLDEHVEHFQGLLGKMNISHDVFIRTTDQKRHWPVAQAVWMKLVEAGDIYKKRYAGYYSERHERFVTDKELDENNNLLEDGSPTVWTEDENYFFKLSKYSDKLKKLILDNEVYILPDFRKNEILAFIDRGLEDVSFSRTKDKLPWGVPVPNDSNHVMYVWCDALINYISGLPFDSVEERLQNANGAYVHVIGKDINRFHSLYWVAMLLSAKLPLPKHILVHGFINDAQGKKMSKSVGNVVDPIEKVEQISADAMRFYLLQETGVGGDMNFSDERYIAVYNSMLANNFGNLSSRIGTLIVKFLGGEFEVDVDFDEDIIDQIQPLYVGYVSAMEVFDTQKAIQQTYELLDVINKYINVQEPWSISDPKQQKQVLLTCLEAYYHCIHMMAPFVPEACEKLKPAFGIEEFNIQPGYLHFQHGNTYKIEKPEVLFPRI